MNKLHTLIFAILLLVAPVYFCNASTITSFSPVAGVGGTEVTIYGTDFSGINKIFFGNTETTSFSIINGSTIKAIVPNGFSDGVIKIESVINGQTVSITSSSSFKHPPIYFTPTSGGVGEEITISSNSDISGATDVYFNTTHITPSETSSPTFLLVNVPYGATTGKIKVVTGRGTFISDYDFTVGTVTRTDTTTYTVVSGDSLSKIAAKYNTTVDNIMSLNSSLITDKDKIEVGWVLTVPNTPVTTTSSTTTTTSSSTTKTSIKFNGIVPVCNTGAIDANTGNYVNDCDFDMVMALINNIINFALVTLATPLFAIIIIYAGYLYLTASGNSGNISTAKKILQNAIIGYIIALAAWIIVKSILLSFGFTGPMYLS